MTETITSMKKRHVLLFIIVIAVAAQAGATEWYGFSYEFPHFRCRADQLLGTDTQVPEMFPVAVHLNDYVRELQQSGRLKNKPVVYDLFSSIWRDNIEVRKDRQRFAIEVYETETKYRINVNSRENFIGAFDRDELIRIIDYFASDSFEPFFCDATMTRSALSRELLFKKIAAVSPPTYFEEKSEYEVYRMGEWNIRMTGGDFYVFFSVFEGAQCIKSLNVPYITDSEHESNDNSRIKVYPLRLNIHRYDPDNPRYSYFYAENRFYDLKN